MTQYYFKLSKILTYVIRRKYLHPFNTFFFWLTIYRKNTLGLISRTDKSSTLMGKAWQTERLQSSKRKSEIW